jgi:hypothetical protein
MAFDSYTKLVINFNGLDTANTYTAETGQTVTFAGTAQLDTAEKKYGASSLLLDGNSDYVTVPDSDDWQLDAGNGSPFTVDFWVYFNSVAGSSAFFSHSTDSTHKLYGFWSTDNNLYLGCANGAGVYSFYIQRAFTASAGQWYHIAYVRVNNDNGATAWRMFVDGVKATVSKTAGTNWNDNMPNFTGDFTIGVNATTYMNGWIDGFRISKGVARWTDDFTPPTAEFTGTSIGKVNGVSYASIGKVGGVAKASIGKISGVA